MKKALFLMVFCVLLQATELTESQKEEADFRGRAFASEIKKDFENGSMQKLANRTDKALEYMVDRGTNELEKRGFYEEAYQYRHQFDSRFRGVLERSVVTRDIGDHKPLIQWLQDYYDILELALGVETCKALHLSDIKTLNHCIPVVFKPCTFEMDSVTIPRKEEYKNHFAEDDTYYGLMPVVVYWLCDIPCLFATSGVGAMLCGPIASVAEYSVAKWVAPRVSDWIFERACE